MELKQILIKRFGNKSCDTFLTRYCVKVDEEGCAHYVEIAETLEEARKTLNKNKDCILKSQPGNWKFPS